MTAKSPKHWHRFLQLYGHAVFTAQLLEKDLANLLWFLEARKRDVLRRPTPADLIALINELDGNPIGNLIHRLEEFQLDHSIVSLLKLANGNRIDLVHHFTVRYAIDINENNKFADAIQRVNDLREPILTAHAKVQSLVIAEIERMRVDTEQER
ncbi:hypothetical protein [Blastomonas sp. CACIA14H2]|uniref:hypothetical protein n=1 Tax=Blastomonas sp. CACIA14H2 TaxID=1419876 RepID=UPI004057D9D5